MDKLFFIRTENGQAMERMMLTREGNKTALRYAYFRGEPLGEPSVKKHKNAVTAQWVFTHTADQLIRAGYKTWWP